MKYCVAVLDIGETEYAHLSRPILTDYFTKNNIPFQFITSPEPEVDGKYIETKNSHPSWWKMIIHKILPGYDYIICWDLDLLPRLPSSDILSHFDFTKLTMAFDSPGYFFSFAPNFKYNGGLIGIPASLRDFTQGVFDKHAPGDLASYEQYHLNEEIAKQNIPVHELPRNINFLYPSEINNRELFYNSICLHYTGGYGTQENRVKLIQNHYNTYFANSESYLFPTRNHLITEFIPKNSRIAEIGVFKGDFSKFLFSQLEPSHLGLFDLFEGICGSGNQDGNNMEYVNLDDEYNNLLNHFNDNKNVSIHKGDSAEQIEKHYPDDYFDCIYIDAQHTYECVKKDLEISYRKIKDGGFIMGHDYDINNQKTDNYYDFSGVRHAVRLFCQQYNLSILAKGMDGCISFCIHVKKE